MFLLIIELNPSLLFKKVNSCIPSGKALTRFVNNGGYQKTSAFTAHGKNCSVKLNVFPKSGKDNDNLDLVVGL